MPANVTSTQYLDDKIKQINEQIAMFYRREKVSATLLGKCIGVSTHTVSKMMGRAGNPHTITLLPLVKVMDFLGYDVSFVKRTDEGDTVWDNPEKALILNQLNHEIKRSRAQRNAKRRRSPQVKVKKPRSVKAGRYEQARQDAQNQREDAFSMFD